MIQFMPNLWILLMLINMKMFMLNYLMNFFSSNKFKF